MNQNLAKILNSKRITDFIQVGQLKRGIDEDGLPLELERILPAFSEISYAHRNIPLEQFRDSVSPHQIYSKAWIIRSLLEIKGTFSKDEVAIEQIQDINLFIGGSICSFAYFGSWLGFGAALIAEVAEYFSSRIITVNLIDRDEKAMEFAIDLIVALGYNSRSVVTNMEDIHPNDEILKSDLITNLSVEHLSKEVFNKWWNLILGAKTSGYKRLIVLQSTNMDADDHVNKCNYIEDLIPPSLTVLYTGKLQFGDCDRFMVIGTL